MFTTVLSSKINHNFGTVLLGKGLNASNMWQQWKCIENHSAKAFLSLVDYRLGKCIFLLACIWDVFFMKDLSRLNLCSLKHSLWSASQMRRSSCWGRALWKRRPIRAPRFSLDHGRYVLVLSFCRFPPSLTVCAEPMPVLGKALSVGATSSIRVYN